MCGKGDSRIAAVRFAFGHFQGDINEALGANVTSLALLLLVLAIVRRAYIHTEAGSPSSGTPESSGNFRDSH